MTNPKAIQVMIVDDHDLVRSGLKLFIQSVSDFELVGEASSGEKAVEVCRALRPDIILMDLVMPGMGGVEATRRIHQENHEVRIIAITSFSERQMIADVLRAGAIGYLLKNVSIDELEAAVRNAMAGRPSLAPEALTKLVNADPGQAETPDFELSRRELEVLALLVSGLNNLQIANRLSVSRSTIKSHMCNIFNKLGVSNRVEAVSMALKHRLVPPPESPLA